MPRPVMCRRGWQVNEDRISRVLSQAGKVTGKERAGRSETFFEEVKNSERGESSEEFRIYFVYSMIPLLCTFCWSLAHTEGKNNKEKTKYEVA